MPDPTIEEALAEAYASAPNVIIYQTIELMHASFPSPLRFVHDRVDLVATLEADAPYNPSETVTFTGLAFELTLPELNSGPGVELLLEMDNVALEIEDAINQALATTDRVEVLFRPYLNSDLSQPAGLPLRMTIQTISADQFRIKARATVGDFSNRKFPFEEYNLLRFRSLV